jgi:hypothetical protein
MVLRALAFLLALLMFWPAASPVQGELAWAAEAVEVAATSAATEGDFPAAEPPAPAQAEPASDLNALPAHGSRAPDAGFLMARPRPDADPNRRAPDLAGPQRPPCRVPLAV